jgi:hypothetical protein
MGRHHIAGTPQVIHFLPKEALHNYHCYMEPRAADLEIIETLRSARVKAVQSSSNGRLAPVLMSKDDAERFVYVVKLLDVHPALGKVAGRRLLDSLGLNHFSRIGDLSADNVQAMLSACGEQA